MAILGRGYNNYPATSEGCWFLVSNWSLVPLFKKSKIMQPDIEQERSSLHSSALQPQLLYVMYSNWLPM